MPTEKKELITDEMSERIIEATEKLATESGADSVTVRRILRVLGITNRVFYNRFHNVGEVLDIVYKNTILKIRECISEKIDPDKDFFEQVNDIVATTLIMSYESKMRFNNYVFESDSLSESNYKWWTGEIKKLIEFAKEKKIIKDVDSDVISYAIWCFCRGYNADAVGRNLPRDEAVENFKYSFSYLIEGLKA